MALCSAAALSLAGGAGAATIVSTITSDEFGTDPASCSLREAVEAARLDAAFGGCPSGSGADTISLPAATFELSRPGFDATNVAGDLDVFDGGALSISHAGPAAAVIDAGGIDRVIQVSDPGTSLTVSGVTLRNGKVAAGNNGGGIRNSESDLTLTDVTMSGNSTTASGGAISNQAKAARWR